MFAKIFNQIFDSSIVDEPQTRFTFMDFLILADKNGVVDMTHEAIARRTNRPLSIIRRTITELEGPDPRSRSPEANGARIFRLDEHRDWGWGIVNYDYYRKIATQEQRRERTKLRTRKWRERKGKASQASPNVTVTFSDDLPSASAYSSSCTSFGKTENLFLGSKAKPANQQQVEDYCASIGLPRSDGEAMFLHWQEKGWAKVKDWKLTIQKWKSFGYLPSQKKQSRNTFPPALPTWGDRKAQKQMIDEVQEQKNELFKLKHREGREFTPEEQRKYEALAKRLEQLKSA